MWLQNMIESKWKKGFESHLNQLYHEDEVIKQPMLSTYTFFNEFNFDKCNTLSTNQTSSYVLMYDF